jgi:hypothetical protein
MSELKVKTVSPPARCEICHQSDLFRPENNYCRRCADLPIKKSPVNSQLFSPAVLGFKNFGGFNRPAWLDSRAAQKIKSIGGICLLLALVLIIKIDPIIIANMILNFLLYAFMPIIAGMYLLFLFGMIGQSVIQVFTSLLGLKNRASQQSPE